MRHIFDRYLFLSVGRWYLHNTVRPALANPVSGPHVVPIFCQPLHQSVLIRSQLDMVEVQRGRLISTTLHVTNKKECGISTAAQIS